MKLMEWEIVDKYKKCCTINLEKKEEYKNTDWS